MNNTTADPRIIIGDSDQYTKEITDPMEALQIVSQSLDGKINSLIGEFRTKFHALLEALEDCSPGTYGAYQQNVTRRLSKELHRSLDLVKETGNLEAIQRRSAYVDGARKQACDEGLEDYFDKGMNEYLLEKRTAEAKENDNRNNNKTS